MTMPMGRRPADQINNLRALTLVLALYAVMLTALGAWNQARIQDLEEDLLRLTRVADAVTLEHQQRLDALDLLFEECAEDNGWNPVIGCFDLD